MVGWVKVHRKLENREWYHDVNVLKLFIHFLIKVNHENKRRRGIEIKKGEFITSLKNLSTGSGLSVQQVRTSLEKLKSTGDVTCTSTSKNTLISLVRREEYQGSDEKATHTSTSIPTNKQQTNNKQTTTTKECKEYKELKEEKKKEDNKEFLSIVSNVVKVWNALKKDDRYFKVCDHKDESVMKTIKYAVNKVLQKYDRQAISKAIQNYYDFVMSKDPDDKYFKSRYSLYSLLADNGTFEKFLNK